MKYSPLIILLLFLSCSDEGIDWSLNEDAMESWNYVSISDSIGRRYGVRWQKNNPNGYQA